MGRRAFVVNSPVRSCCGSPAGECRCGGRSPLPRPVVVNGVMHALGRATFGSAEDPAGLPLPEPTVPPRDTSYNESVAAGGPGLPLPPLGELAEHSRRLDELARVRNARGEDRAGLPLPRMNYREDDEDDDECVQRCRERGRE